jgi:four helix bundle protein
MAEGGRRVGTEIGGREKLNREVFMAEQIRSFHELRVYNAAIELQQNIFKASKKWPSEEKFSLIDQVRRSSRAIGANISESWAKRKYPAHFVSKLTDADGELQETSHWLWSAFLCNYISPGDYSRFQVHLEDVGKKLGKMMSMPEKFTQSEVGRLKSEVSGQRSENQIL